MGNPVSVAFRQTAQRVPTPSDGWCVIVEEDLESAAGILVAAGSGAGQAEQANARAFRLVATSGCILLPNGGKVPHEAKAGDLVFPAPETRSTPSHPLWPPDHLCMRVVDIASYLVDEGARTRAQARAAGLTVPERAH